MTTVNDLITGALRDVGVIASGESPSADDAADSLEVFNQMIGQWQVLKMYVTGQHRVSFTATGAQTYTVGPSATVDIQLPVSIDSAFYTLNGIDYPVHVLTSFEDYEDITLKVLTGTIPSAVFFQRSAPTGTLYVWPQPNTGTLNLVVRDVLDTYTDLTTDITVPAEYALAMRLSLAELLLTAYSLPPRPDIAFQAAKARKVIKRNNLNIPMMGQPQELLNNGRFSIYTGQ